MLLISTLSLLCAHVRAGASTAAGELSGIALLGGRAAEAALEAGRRMEEAQKKRMEELRRQRDRVLELEEAHRKAGAHVEGEEHHTQEEGVTLLLDEEARAEIEKIKKRALLYLPKISIVKSLDLYGNRCETGGTHSRALMLYLMQSIHSIHTWLFPSPCSLVYSVERVHSFPLLKSDPVLNPPHHHHPRGPPVVGTAWVTPVPLNLLRFLRVHPSWNP